MANNENLKPFRPGEDERRNKKGRNPTKFLTALLTKQLKTKKDIIIEGVDPLTGKPARIRVPMPTKEVIVQALLRQAAKGNMIAIKEVFDRTEGKAPQPLVGEDGGAIQTEMTVNIIKSDIPISESEADVT